MIKYQLMIPQDLKAIKLIPTVTGRPSSQSKSQNK